MFDKSTIFPGTAALVPTVGAALVIAAGKDGLINRYILSLKPIVFIGLISYPLYLWHWPLLAFPFIVFGAEPDFSVQMSAVVASFIFAAVTYSLIENPIRRRNLGHTWQFFVAIAIPAAAGAVFIFNHGAPSRTNIEPYIAASSEVNRYLEWDYSQNKLCNQRFAYPLRKKDWHFCMLEKDSPPTIMLVGNSYANHLYPGLVNRPN